MLFGQDLRLRLLLQVTLYDSDEFSDMVSSSHLQLGSPGTLPQREGGGGAEIPWAPSVVTSFLDSAVSSVPCRVCKGVADCIFSH